MEGGSEGGTEGGINSVTLGSVYSIIMYNVSQTIDSML